MIWTIVNGRPLNPKVDQPAIVLEFLSAGRAAWRRDHVEKREEYFSAGLQEYWVFDRFARQLTVYRLENGQAVERQTREGDIYSTPLLPGFEVPLAELLGAADRGSEPT